MPNNKILLIARGIRTHLIGHDTRLLKRLFQDFIKSVFDEAEAKKRFRVAVSKFNQLQSINNETKESLISTIRYFEKLVTKNIISKGRIRRNFLLSFFPSLIFSLIIFLLVANRWLGEEMLGEETTLSLYILNGIIKPQYLTFKATLPNISQDQFFLCLGMTFFVSSVLYLIFFALFLLIRSATNSNTLLCLLFVFFAASTFTAIANQIVAMKQIFTHWQFTFIAFNGFAITGFVIYSILFFGSLVTAIDILGGISVKYPDAMAVDKLLHILERLENNRFQWRSIKARKLIANDLEKVSNYIQRFPVIFKSSDQSFNFWLQKTTINMSNSVHSWKYWLYTPKADTREHLINAVSSALVCIASGNLDAFPKTEIDEKPKVTLKDKVKIIFSRASTIALPWILFCFFQATPLRLEGNLEGYVKVGIFILTALTLLTEIDSNFNARISVLKEVINLIPGIGKDKKD